MPASAALATTQWFYGAADNSAAAGVSADFDTAIIWKDGWVSEQQPDTNLTTSPTAQFNQANLLGQDESMLLFGFGNTGIAPNEYQVVSARLYFMVDDSFALGSALSLGVYGIQAADTGWVDGPSGGATWTDKSGTGTGWTGGATFGASLQSGGLFYGTRSITVGAADLDTTWYSLDITGAFQDLVDGVNGGIALASFTNGSTFEGNDTALQIYSDGAGADLAAFRPGLLVEIQKLPEPVTLTAVPKASLKLAAAGVAAGTVVSWTKEDSGAITNLKGRYAGAATATLTISALKAEDAGIYRAKISSAAGVLIQRFRVVLLTQPPALETPVFPQGQVATTFTYELKALPGAQRAPAGYTATGLPTGLVIDRLTGVISGQPRASGNFQVSVQAFHAGGKSPLIKVPLMIDALPPGLSGNWVAPVPRSSILADSLGLGCRLDLAVAVTGKITGALINGPSRWALASAVIIPAKDGIPVASLTVVRKGLPTLTLQLQFGQAGADLLSGVLTSAAAVAQPAQELAFNGWRNGWVLKATATQPQRLPSAFTGRLHTLLDIPASLVADPATPQGTGYAVLTIASSGVATVSNAMTGAGQAITGTCAVGPQGQVAIYQILGTSGSLVGTLYIDPGTQTVSGTLDWAKRPVAPAVKDRTYRDGYGPLLLTVEGGRYTPPASGSIILGLTQGTSNARLSFFEGNVSHQGTDLTATSPNIQATIARSAVVTVPVRGKADNPAFTTLVINATTGAISGSFILTDADPVSIKAVKPLLKRTVSFQGLIVSRPGQASLGVGWFLCPALPAVSGQTTATTPILAGQTLLEPASHPAS